MINFQGTRESEVSLWISDSSFHSEVFAFCIFYCQNFWSKMSWWNTVNPTYLIGCCDSTSVQPYPQDYLMFCMKIHKKLIRGILWILVLLEVMQFMTREIRIYEASIYWIVRSWLIFYNQARGRCTYNNFCLLYFSFLYFLF